MSRITPIETTLQYTRSKGKRLTYTVIADQMGAYGIRLGDKILRAVYPPSDYVGKKRWGSKAQEEEAIRLAKIDIEQLNGMTED